MIENNEENKIKFAEKVISKMSQEEKENLIFDYLINKYSIFDFEFQYEWRENFRE